MVFSDLDQQVRDGQTLLIYPSEWLVSVMLARSVSTSDLPSIRQSEDDGTVEMFGMRLVEVQYYTGYVLSDLLLIFEEMWRKTWSRRWHEFITLVPFYTEMAPLLDLIEKMVKEGVVIVIVRRERRYSVNLDEGDGFHEKIRQPEDEDWTLDYVFQRVAEYAKAREGEH